MSINLTDEIEVKTKKGKLGAAKQIFLEGDTQTVENEIQDINSRHNDLNSKHESLSSTVSEHTNQIESNQNQITANKSTQDAKNASLDANMAKLNTRDDQITELVRGITATGGASIATTVTYDNTSSHLASATVQGAIDELQGKKVSFAGIATPTTNPGIPDGPVFWIASEPGAYVNFGNTEIDNTGIFTWDGTSWSFEKLDFGGGNNIEIINDLTTGGEASALSAEQGKVLKGMIDNVSVKHGTFADALDAILASNSVFEWLLVDEVDSGELIKPLWHINSSLVDATGAVVSLATLTAPVFSRDSGDVYVGTTVTITCTSGSTLYYSVNGIAATSTSDVTITINEASVVKAYLKSGDAVSDIVAKSYGIAVDHKFQFKIKLTGDNSTEYVPVVASGSPKYTMTVDWGDGSTPSEYTNKHFYRKECGHTYSGTAGDEFVITLRGTAIPYLHFSESSASNILALVAILENTLDCKTHFSSPDKTMISIGGCSSLNYLSADAFSNSNNNGISLANCSSLTSLEDGFFTNLISGGTIETCNEMFMNTPVSITASQMSELKSRLSQCAVFSSMFYGINNYIEIPNDFFDDVKVKITSVYAFTHTSGNKVTGDAKALYDALQSKVSSAVSTQYAFTGSGLSNRNQVPSAWGGTGS